MFHDFAAAHKRLHLLLAFLQNYSKGEVMGV